MLTLYTLLMVLILFGITIFAHELGHFLVARWCGLVVDVFSIGFGPAIWKKKVGAITYKIGCIPFGGYVALPQMDPSNSQAESTDREARKLPRAAPWKKILVAVAGVTGNMLLAIALAYVVFWGGKSFAPATNECVVGYVETNSLVYAQGLRIGDTITSVNGQAVKDWEQFALISTLNEKLLLNVRKENSETFTIEAVTKEFLSGRYLAGVSPANYCYVLKVMPGSSAEAAGICPKDRIIECNGIVLHSRDHLIDVVNRSCDQLIPVKIERKGQVIEVHVKPVFNESEKRCLIGIQFSTVDVREPWGQIKSHATLIFRILGALLTPKEAKAAARSIGGPVAIFDTFWACVQADIILALWFTGLLNVNLAIMNLLPIPILDGGHVVFALWEMITRRPLHARVSNALMNFFLILIIAFFVWITWRDVGRHAPMARFLNWIHAPTNSPPAEVPAEQK